MASTPSAAARRVCWKPWSSAARASAQRVVDWSLMRASHATLSIASAISSTRLTTTCSTSATLLMLSTPKAYAATAAVAAVEKKSPPVTKAPKRDQKDVLYTTVADIVTGGRRESVSGCGEKVATLVPCSGGRSAGVGMRTACGKKAIAGMRTATGAIAGNTRPHRLSGRSFSRLTMVLVLVASRKTGCVLARIPQ